MPIDPLLTTKDMAQELGVSEVSIRHRIRRGQLPAVKMGPLWRIRKSVLLSYIASLTRDNGAADDR